MTHPGRRRAGPTLAPLFYTLDARPTRVHTMSKRSARVSEPPRRGHIWALPGVSEGEIEYARAKLTGRPHTARCKVLRTLTPEKKR